MATYTDSFNRANGNLTASANWTLTGFDTTELKIISNEMSTDSSSAGYAVWTGSGTWGRTQEVEITIGGTIGSTRVGPMAYVSASGGYVLRVRPDTGAYEFQHVNASGTHTTIGVGRSFGRALVQSDVVKLRVEDGGSSNTLLTSYLNGTSDDTATDTTFTSGDPGVFVDSYGTSTIDAWSADDFVVASAETVTATVTDQTGTALPNETGIDWHWTDSFNGNPTDTGTGESTDGSGVIVVDLSNTSLTTGQFGYLTVKLSNGNVGIAREAID